MLCLSCRKIINQNECIEITDVFRLNLLNESLGVDFEPSKKELAQGWKASIKLTYIISILKTKIPKEVKFF